MSVLFKIVDGVEIPLTSEEILEIESSKVKNLKLQCVDKINALEVTITSRRIREAILGTDNGWLVDIESQIETLRSKL